MSAREQVALDIDGHARDRARAAMSAFVSELQAGTDARDAVVFNRHFAHDVLWGSPYGLTVRGHEQLHAIHRRLLAEGRGGRSRYELDGVLAPTADVAIGHVRRYPVDERGARIGTSMQPGGPFAETALYVLVRRDGEWWLAAGQNTILTARDGGS